MANPVASAGGGLAFVAAILFIFVGIANFTLDQIVPRHIRSLCRLYWPLGPTVLHGERLGLQVRPTAAILEDVPNGLRSRATNLFNDQYNTDNYFGVWSRIGFYFLFIAACLVALILLFSLIQARGPGRLGSLNLSVISLLAFISNTIGTVIWTAIAGILKHQLSRDTIGMSASYGNAIWLLWAIDGLLLFASFGYLGGCIRGRRSQVV
ncbi:uncharacterized protein PGTG_18871 [Puccinia graminis f. sp. tritici CRL 75-36-700-3]|uniref:Uncharacterized protein n=1 Tax=Puccinia graminis f. sp. tritici (strain CRL 75-36-700-3 / race SCCL) TaxID=418459 RepID=E3L905_PUCGT|nr:uncharacterized protein PGTG_18871 [Puccinia graminis f. sp. tritici CRL 75-36-700-3]EFP93030.1 hypothetical protein PGTG_18871 [Puccinia graminis f. sp. tritici CRL 75-36-700-3]